MIDKVIRHGTRGLHPLDGFSSKEQRNGPIGAGLGQLPTTAEARDQYALRDLRLVSHGNVVFEEVILTHDTYSCFIEGPDRRKAERSQGGKIIFQANFAIFLSEDMLKVSSGSIMRTIVRNDADDTNPPPLHPPSPKVPAR